MIRKNNWKYLIKLLFCLIYMFMYCYLHIYLSLFISVYLSILIHTYNHITIYGNLKQKRNIKTIFTSIRMQSNVVVFFPWFLNAFIPERPPMQQAKRYMQSRVISTLEAEVSGWYTEEAEFLIRYSIGVSMEGE